ncbi:hypothetical protein BC941DRAFT_506879 [Chlamydoabsidia padenii]|nr:hypothetical protein BC941DRAFT_506879 [Chlamydoabsidia padenii]
MRKKLDKIADTVYITVPRLGVPPEHTFDTLCKAASHCSAIEDLNLSVGGGEYTDDRTPNDELVIDFKESMNIVKDVLLKQPIVKKPIANMMTTVLVKNQIKRPVLIMDQSPSSGLAIDTSVTGDNNNKTNDDDDEEESKSIFLS